MNKTKSSDDELRSFVLSSFTIREVAQKGGYAPGGSSHALVSKRIKKLGIDTSHFKTATQVSVERSRKTAKDILVVLPDGSLRAKTDQLYRALLEIGRLPECVGCGITDTWNDLPITLEIDHIDGNWLDNRENNLRFLCPNCHSQTSTFRRTKQVLLA